MRRRISLALACAFALVSVAPARADTPLEQARVYFDAGAQAYAAGRYPVAIEAFANAYKLAARPAILFSMAQAERKQFWIDKKPDGIARAIAHYRDYLAQVPEGGRRDDAATALAELEPIAVRFEGAASEAPTIVPTATRLLVSSQAVGARAAIDGGPASPLPRLADLTAGKHHIAVSADGYLPDERDVVVLAGVTTPFELNLREQPALLSVVAESGTNVIVDGRTVGEVPSAHPFEVPSGHHVVALAHNGRQLDREDVTFERGQPRTVTGSLLVTRQRRISEVVLTVGAAGLVTAGVFIGVAAAEQSSAQHILSQSQVMNISNAQLLQYNSDLAARNGWRTASLSTMGGSLGLLAVGGALFLFDHPDGEAKLGSDSPAAPLHVAPAGTVEISALPVAGPGFAGGGVVVTF
jgi:PEGA domain